MNPLFRQIIVKPIYLAFSAGLIPDPLIELCNELVDRARLKVLLTQLGINCVLDVGAHEGGFAVNLRRAGYRGHIISFEPNPQAFTRLKDRFARDRLWEGYNLALGSENTHKHFNITRLTNMSSFLDPKSEPTAARIEVEVKRLDSLFENLVSGLENPRVFLKIDTQGYDLEVVAGAANCIEEIIGLQSEISIQATYVGMPSYLEALERYQSLGFEIANLCTAARNSKTKQIIEYDCIMVRRDALKTL